MSNIKKTQDTLIKTLGHPGHMVSASKSTFKAENPEAVVIFNGNIIAGDTKLWYGDINLSDPETVAKLKETALANRTTLYILREMDARFDTEDIPDTDNFIACMTHKGNLVMSPDVLNQVDVTEDGAFIKEECQPKERSLEELVEEVHPRRTKDLKIAECYPIADMELKKDELVYEQIAKYIVGGDQSGHIHVDNMFISPNTARELNKLLIEFLKLEDIPNFKIAQRFGFANLTYQPVVVIADEIEDGYVYIGDEG